MRIRIIALFLCAGAFAQNSPKRIYLEPRQRGVRNVTLELTREMMKRCPSMAVITEERSASDYRIGIASKATTLYLPNGDAAHVFRAKWTVSGISREICSYLEGLPR